MRRYEAGDYQAAQQEYQRLLGQNPTDARLHYNAGTAAYQAKQFEQAVTNFSTALSSPGETDLLERSYYNLGNTLYRIGDEEPDPTKKMAGWEQAIKQYESALKLNAQDADARFNHDLVQKKLEELKSNSNSPSNKNRSRTSRRKTTKRTRTKNNPSRNRNRTNPRISHNPIRTRSNKISRNKSPHRKIPNHKTSSSSSSSNKTKNSKRPSRPANRKRRNNLKNLKKSLRLSLETNPRKRLTRTPGPPRWGK